DNRRRKTIDEDEKTLNPNLSRPLLVGFPIGGLELNLWIVRRRLQTSLGIDRSGNDLMFAEGRLFPVVMEKSPRVFRLLHRLESSRLPLAIVNSHVNPPERGAVRPSGSGESHRSIGSADGARDNGLHVHGPNRCLAPNRFAIPLFAADGH